jgi:hypothetical protein
VAALALSVLWACWNVPDSSDRACSAFLKTEIVPGNPGTLITFRDLPTTLLALLIGATIAKGLPNMDNASIPWASVVQLRNDVFDGIFTNSSFFDRNPTGS